MFRARATVKAFFHGNLLSLPLRAALSSGGCLFHHRREMHLFSFFFYPPIRRRGSNYPRWSSRAHFGGDCPAGMTDCSLKRSPEATFRRAIGMYSRIR